MTIKKEDKIQIKQFKDSSSNWFVNFSHYYLNEDNELLWASGESDNKEYRSVLQAYIKRNKKTYKPREESVLNQVEIEYSTITFGIHSGKKVNEIDINYLKWMINNFKFSLSQEKLKQEIIQYLK